MRALIKKLPGIRQVFRLKDHVLTQLNVLDQQPAWTEALMWNQAAIMQGIGKNIESTCVVHATLEDHLKHTYAIESALRKHLQRIQSIEDQLAKARSNIQTARYGLTNPEAGLMAHLYASLPSRCALDVGCHVGEIAERLVNAGFLVYAFEPSPPIFAQVQSRLGSRENFHSYNVAIGSEDREMDLHVATDKSGNHRYGDSTQFSSLVNHSMPQDLPFTSKVRVQVRSLASLQKAKEIPSDIGLLKIDTEGYDLEVLRGMGKMNPRVIVAEFWDPEMSLGKSGTNRLEELVGELRGRDYHWHIVLYRIDGSYDISFYCNQPESISKSWGNVFFFRDYQVFTEAMQWCAAVLPRTYFRN